MYKSKRKRYLESFDPLTLKLIAMRLCIASLFAAVMIVSWEMGFYVATVTQQRALPHYRAARVHSVSNQATESPASVVEQEQSQRHTRLHKECVRWQMPTKIPEYTIRHMLVVEDYQLVFCFIPKVGCSNWKRILMVLDNQTKDVDGLTSNEVHINGKFRFLVNYGPKERERILSEYEKFLFVRHPFERLLSVFKNKLEDLENYRRKPQFQRYGKAIIREWRANASDVELATGENTTWAEFVKYLTHPERREKVEKLDNYFSDHWREMYKVCSPCAVKYDFIGKMESVENEAKYLLKKWKADDKARYLGAETSRPTNSSYLYENYFTHLETDDLRKLWEIYERDFSLFGYPRPPFVPF